MVNDGVKSTEKEAVEVKDIAEMLPLRYNLVRTRFTKELFYKLLFLITHQNFYFAIILLLRLINYAGKLVSIGEKWSSLIKT